MKPLTEEARQRIRDWARTKYNEVRKTTARRRASQKAYRERKRAAKHAKA